MFPKKMTTAQSPRLALGTAELRSAYTMNAMVITQPPMTTAVAIMGSHSGLEDMAAMNPAAGASAAIPEMAIPRRLKAGT